MRKRRSSPSKSRTKSHSLSPSRVKERSVEIPKNDEVETMDGHSAETNEEE